MLRNRISQQGIVITFLLFASSLFFFNCSASSPSSGPITIPFKFIDNRPFIEVEVNGKKGMFIVDTGGRHGFNSEFAEKAQILRSDSFRISGAGDGIQWASFGSETDISIGTSGVISTTTRPIILDISMIKDSLDLPFFDGIIGEQLFREFNVSINYPNREMTLYSKEFSPSGYEEIPFSFFRNQIPVVELRIGEISGDFTIDTGDRSFLTLFPEFFQSSGLSNFFNPGELKITGYGVGGPVMAREFYLNEVRIGSKHLLKDVKTRVPDHSSGGWANNEHAGNVGSAFLMNYEIIFDYSEQKIFIK
jgi:hypothetical protein